MARFQETSDYLQFFDALNQAKEAALRRQQFGLQVQQENRRSQEAMLEREAREEERKLREQQIGLQRRAQERIEQAEQADILQRYGRNLRRNPDGSVNIEESERALQEFTENEMINQALGMERAATGAMGPFQEEGSPGFRVGYATQSAKIAAEKSRLENEILKKSIQDAQKARASTGVETFNPDGTVNPVGMQRAEEIGRIQAALTPTAEQHFNLEIQAGKSPLDAYKSTVESAEEESVIKTMPAAERNFFRSLPREIPLADRIQKVQEESQKLAEKKHIAGLKMSAPDAKTLEYGEKIINSLSEVKKDMDALVASGDKDAASGMFEYFIKKYSSKLFGAFPEVGKLSSSYGALRRAEVGKTSGLTLTKTELEQVLEEVGSPYDANFSDKFKKFWDRTLENLDDKLTDLESQGFDKSPQFGPKLQFIRKKLEESRAASGGSTTNQPSGNIKAVWVE